MAFPTNKQYLFSGTLVLEMTSRLDVMASELGVLVALGANPFHAGTPFRSSCRHDDMRRR